MPTYSINGYNVEFPKEAYGCQIRYMEAVLRALSTTQNALLESPTGTGKTLCLLCAVLAWQNSVKCRMPKKPAVNASELGGNAIGKKPTGTGYPVIVYASRTHTQLSQVIAELKSTAYRPKTTILGSRDQLCVNPSMSKHKGTVLNSACSALCASHSCFYRNNLTGYNGFNEGSDGSRAPILDIEDLMALGKKDNICGFYYSRIQAPDSDLVLLPYNYLLDPVVRSRVDIDWKNAVIIFDEAHNLERSACEAASVTINSTMLTAIIGECKDVIRHLQASEDPTGATGGAGSDTDQPVSAPPTHTTQGDTKMIKPKLGAVVEILKSLFSLEEVLDNAPVRHQEQFGGDRSPKALALPGSWLYTTLESVGFPYQKAIDTIVQLNRMQELLIFQASELLASTGGTGTAAAAAQEPKLIHLIRLLSRAFRGVSKENCMQGSLDYKVFIAEEKPKTSGNGGFNNFQQRMKPVRKLCYWAFSPGIALEELKKVGVGSILLTSGTLSPLGAFQVDMKVPFGVQLENPHVIDSNQFWVGAVATGVDGKRLNSSYANRDTHEYQDCLGNSIIHILKTGAAGGIRPGGQGPGQQQQTRQSGFGMSSGGGFVSNVTARKAFGDSADMCSGHSTELTGGVLVFFPSYDVMDRQLSRWRTTGVYEQLERIGGAVIVEPRGTTAGGPAAGSGTSGQQQQMDGRGKGGYYPKKVVSGAGLTSNGSGGSSTSGMFGSNDNSATELQLEENQIKSLVTQLDKVLITKKRCIMMAVFQGKVSEGIDFKDARGRVIIVTGIPFAPMTDPWVVLKKQHLDERKASGGAGDGALNGSGWYIQSASRAVNQALGRIIRHKKDWGAIFLMDDRFLGDGQISNLSKWIRPAVVKYQTLSLGLQSFRKFVNECYDNPYLAVQAPVTVPRRAGMTLSYDPSDNRQEDTRIRTLAISAANVTSGAGYIDPSLLLSQQQSSTSNVSTSTLNEQHFNLQSTESKHVGITPRPVGLAGALAMNINPFAVNPVKTEKSSSLSLSSSSSLSLSSGSSSGGKGNIASSSSNSGLSLPEYNNRPSLPTPPSSQSIPLGAASEPATAAVTGSKLKQIIGTRLTLEAGTTATNSEVSNKRDVLKRLKERVKLLVPGEMTTAFSNVIVQVKVHQFASMVHIQEFVSDIVSAFTPRDTAGSAGFRACVLVLEDMVAILDALMCLIPARYMELYIATAEKALTVLMLQKRLTGGNITASVSVPVVEPRVKPVIDAKSVSPVAAAKATTVTRKPTVTVGSSITKTSSSYKYDASASADAVLSKFPDQASQYENRPSTDTAEGTGTWQPSKRAKLLAGATVSAPKPVSKPTSSITPGAVKPSPLAFLNSRTSLPPAPPRSSQPPALLGVQSTKAFRATNANIHSNCSSGSGANSKSSVSSGSGSGVEDVLSTVLSYKFGTKGANFVEQVCNVCMETAKRPCANRQCGHICCEGCWKKWFNSKSCGSSCPVCRQPASIESLVFVVRKD